MHEVRYYAARGHALRFIAAVVEALDRVRDDPCSFPKVGKNRSLRRVLTKRFPFALVYVVNPTEPAEPLVIAVAHGSRRPGYWRRRVRRRPR